MHRQDLPVPFPLFILTGPTAVGKTSVAIKFAKKINGEIINADSIQIYRGLDIGSAKPSRSERSMAPHHLVDILEPDEPFSAADFLRISSRIADRIINRGRAVILSGGTGLYINTFMHGLSQCPGRDVALRNSLEQYRSKNGTDALFQILKEADPESAVRLHQNDRYRIVRALEIYYATGKTISSWWKANPAKDMSYCRGSRRHYVAIGLMRPRDQLYRRIETRIEQMMDQGFEKEVRMLIDAGYHPELKPLQSLGYRQMVHYIAGRISLDEAVHEIKKATRRYAKRQITWFRAIPGITWYHPDEFVTQWF